MVPKYYGNLPSISKKRELRPRVQLLFKRMHHGRKKMILLCLREPPPPSIHPPTPSPCVASFQASSVCISLHLCLMASIDPCTPIHRVPSSTQTAGLSVQGVSEGGHCQVVFAKHACFFFSSFRAKTRLLRVFQEGSSANARSYFHNWSLETYSLSANCSETLNYVRFPVRKFGDLGSSLRNRNESAQCFSFNITSSSQAWLRERGWRCRRALPLPCLHSSPDKREQEVMEGAGETETTENEGGGDGCLATTLTSLTTAGPGSYTQWRTHVPSDLINM